MKDRKTEIINATLGLAAENGLAAVSMQMIADKVGITKASLYNHFSSRDRIVEAMYEQLRNESVKRSQSGRIDYDSLDQKQLLKDILMQAVNTYRETVRDPQMHLFYSIIMNERSISSAAADIMVRETRTMINTTKTLFYALHVKKIASFENADAAAFSFAMAVHSIIDYEFDLERAGQKADQHMMEDYISEFSRIYAKGAKKS